MAGDVISIVEKPRLKSNKTTNIFETKGIVKLYNKSDINLLLTFDLTTLCDTYKCISIKTDKCIARINNPQKIIT